MALGHVTSHRVTAHYGNVRNIRKRFFFVLQDDNDKPLSDVEILSQALVFINAGHETSSVGMSWCLYNLARFPEHQQKCYEEVQELLEKKGNTELEW